MCSGASFNTLTTQSLRSCALKCACAICACSTRRNKQNSRLRNFNCSGFRSTTESEQSTKLNRMTLIRTIGSPLNLNALVSVSGLNPTTSAADPALKSFPLPSWIMVRTGTASPLKVNLATSGFVKMLNLRTRSGVPDNLGDPSGRPVHAGFSLGW